MSVVWHKKRSSLLKPLIQRFWGLGLAFLGLILGLMLYSNWERFLSHLDSTPIKSFNVTHRTRFTTDADILAVLPKSTEFKGYFGQDIQDLKQRLLSISWVKDVVVRKVYPDRLNIRLYEHKPVAHWNDHFYISEQGEIFSLPKEKFAGEHLPVLYGPDSESKAVLDAWNKIKHDLTLRNLRLYSVAMDLRGAWTITLDNGVKLILGRGEWLPKIDRFVFIFPHIHTPENAHLSYVDLRYEYGVAVGFNKNKF